MKGGMLVTKSSTGSFLIEDIKICVTHGGTGTYICADDAVNSSDLYRAINSGVLMLLVDSMPQVPVKPAQQPGFSKEELLQNENQELREALARSTQQGDSLQTSMSSLQDQLTTLLAAVGRIETAPKAVQTIVVAEGQARSIQAQEPSERLPVFVPDDLIPKDAEVRINFHTETAEKDTTSDTVSKLRELRRRNKG
jgi:hypothetical protein